MINCKTTIERLYPFLDRELTEDEHTEVQEHLSLCPPCARHFQFEAGVLRFVSASCRNVKTPESLLQRIAAARQAVVAQGSAAHLPDR
jgi:mycothiol system anti-sigma-R factor